MSQPLGPQPDESGPYPISKINLILSSHLHLRAASGIVFEVFSLKRKALFLNLCDFFVPFFSVGLFGEQQAYQF
jgi:hypothetical protein